MFSAGDEDLDLVSVDEFYKTAPETITKPEVTKDNEHELYKQRLLWEVDMRKE